MAIDVDWRKHRGENPREVWIPQLVGSRLKAPNSFLDPEDGYVSVQGSKGREGLPLSEARWVGLVDRGGALLLEAGDEERPRRSSRFAATLMGLEEQELLCHDAELTGIIAAALERHVRPDQLGSTADTVQLVRAHADHLAAGGPPAQSPLRVMLPEKEPSPGFFRRILNDLSTF